MYSGATTCRMRCIVRRSRRGSGAHVRSRLLELSCDFPFFNAAICRNCARPGAEDTGSGLCHLKQVQPLRSRAFWLALSELSHAGAAVVAAMNGCPATASAPRCAPDASHRAGINRRSGPGKKLKTSRDWVIVWLARLAGIEPAISGLAIRCCIQFSFRRVARGRGRVAPITASLFSQRPCRSEVSDRPPSRCTG